MSEECKLTNLIDCDKFRERVETRTFGMPKAVDLPMTNTDFLEDFAKFLERGSLDEFKMP